MTDCRLFGLCSAPQLDLDPQLAHHEFDDPAYHRQIDALYDQQSSHLFEQPFPLIGNESVPYSQDFIHHNDMAYQNLSHFSVDPRHHQFPPQNQGFFDDMTGSSPSYGRPHNSFDPAGPGSQHSLTKHHKHSRRRRHAIHNATLQTIADTV